MNADGFRELALALPEAVEQEHMGHPDFRVRGKIFATLGPKEAWGMLKLTPEQQERVVHVEPEAFQRIAGAWGAGGATKVVLRHAKKADVRRLLLTAWRNVAPKGLSEDS